VNHRSPYLLPTLSFLAGGIVGAGVSLLLAPRSGKATRQLITDKLTDGADSVRALRDEVVTRGEAAWDEATGRLGEAAEALSGPRTKKTNHKGEVASA
jgi:gas vesicle protein